MLRTTEHFIFFLLVSFLEDGGKAVRTLSWQSWLSPSGPRVSHFRGSPSWFWLQDVPHFRSMIADSRGVRGCSHGLWLLCQRLGMFKTCQRLITFGDHISKSHCCWKYWEFRACQKRACKNRGFQSLPGVDKGYRLANDQGFQGLPETVDFRACQRQDTVFQVLPETRGFRTCRKPGL